MAKTVTLSSIRQQIRQRADMVNSQFVTDQEANQYINNSYAELYDILTQKFQNYYLSSSTIPLVAGTDTYNLPGDFYKMLGVDLLDGGGQNPITLKPFMFSERNRYTYVYNLTYYGRSYLQYSIQGNTIRFIPNSTISGTVKLWYIPAYTTLTSDSDTLDGVNGWEEWVILDVAEKMLMKEESDVQAIMAEKARVTRRIEEAANNRDAGEPLRVTDIYRDRFMVWP